MTTDELAETIRRVFECGEPVAIVDGERWVRLPKCDGCASFRFDWARQRWFHDPNCTKTRRSQQ